MYFLVNSPFSSVNRGSGLRRLRRLLRLVMVSWSHGLDFGTELEAERPTKAAQLFFFSIFFVQSTIGDYDT